MSSDRKIYVDFPTNGIDVNSEDSVQTAKYLENLLLGNSNNGKIRNGTVLNSQREDAIGNFNSDISYGCTFLKQDGTSENLLYSKYYTAIPYISTNPDVEINPVIDEDNIVEITIDISGINQASKNYLKERLYDDVNIYISQTNLPFYARIFNVVYNDTEIYLQIEAELEDFNFDEDLEEYNFVIYYQRAGIVLETESIYLKADLDANTITKSLNYKNNLLFFNGVDPVMVYNGEVLEELLSNAFVSIVNIISIVENTITFTINSTNIEEYEQWLTIDSWVSFAKENIEQETSITDVTFGEDIDGFTEIILECYDDILLDSRTILYKKSIPRFSYIELAHNRLWALGAGRPYKNRFREDGESQYLYYTATQDTIYNWFDEKTSQIKFFNLAVNNPNPENLEVIKFFNGELLILGRHTTQLYSGNDPDSNFDGKNITIGNFSFNKLFSVGILQKNLCQELPNNFSFISSYGKAYSFKINRYNQIELVEDFMNAIGSFFETQLGFIDTNNDYREMTSFLYPHANLLGIKIKNECVIYQIKNKGFWTVFTENFSTAKSFFYNHIDKNLYLGMDKGAVLKYADKLDNSSYRDFNVYTGGYKKIMWKINYNWLYLQEKWINDKIDIYCKTLLPMVVNVVVFENNNETDPIEDTINITQEGYLLDTYGLNDAILARQSFESSYESIRFKGLSFSIHLYGFVEDYFTLKKLVLSGGIDVIK